MAVFKDQAQMYEVLGGLWEGLLNHEVYGPKFKDAGLKIKFVVTDPAAVLWVTPQGVIRGDADLRADVEMTLSGDTAHSFWLKQLSLPVALARRSITSKGSINKVMQVLPMLKPLHEAYPAICDRYGLPR